MLVALAFEIFLGGRQCKEKTDNETWMHSGLLNTSIFFQQFGTTLNISFMSQIIGSFIVETQTF